MSASADQHGAEHRRVVDFDLFKDHRFTSAGRPHAAALMLNSEVGCGIYWTPRNGGHWIINSYELATRAAQDPELFSSTAMTLPPMPEDLEPKLIPLNLDPPEHGAYRLPLAAAFSPQRVAALVPVMRGFAGELIESVEGEGRCDFVEAIAEPFPIITFMRLMGMDTSRLTEFRRWITDLMAAEQEPRARSYTNIRTMMGELIQARRAERRDDLLSALLDSEINGRPPSDEEMQGYCMLLFAAGLDTVANALAFAFEHLSKDQALQARLRDEPGLIPGAVEEFLRSYGVPMPPRTVTRDAEFAGMHLKKGERVALLLPAANLDPSAFPEPGEFRLDRPNMHHIAFNTGPHICAGRHLARLELQIFLEEWLARMPNIRRDPLMSPEYRYGLAFACVKLPLVWSAPRPAAKTFTTKLAR